MIVRKSIHVVLALLLIPFGNLFAQSVYSGNHYHNVKEVQQVLKEINEKHKAGTRLHIIADTPGGLPVTVLEIGSGLKDVPAIFVGANFEGNIPVATEGALRLINMLIDSVEYTAGNKWYILPQPNPDAAKNYFETVKYGRTVNDFEINNDADEAINEDGFDDLNGDGYITQMRVKSPEGTHIISEADSRIMIPASAEKGERGEYKIYSEGLDNDNDGEYNEDGEGGINVGIAFPHLFPQKNKEAGVWPGQTPEVYNIMRFIYERPEIAMVFTLGSSDFCIAPPEGGRKGDVNLDRIKIPGRYARMLNADANRTYTMDEIMELVREYVPEGSEYTPHMIAGMLGLGAAVNPLEEDLKFYSAFSEEYKEYLSSKKFNTNRLKAEPAKDGSFELWAYYHLGVPSFSMNLFTLPLEEDENAGDKKSLSTDDIKKMDAEEFIELGEDKVNELLKSSNASEQFSASALMEMVKTKKLTPEQLAGRLEKHAKSQKKDGLSEKEKAMLAWSDKEWEGKGFAAWQKFSHPILGEVEIGGFIPYLETTPKADDLDSLLSAQLPWLLQLTKKLPRISFEGEKLTDMGSGIFKLELFVENNGQLPWPIAMGQRNKQPAPTVLVLEGDIELLEGLKRTPLQPLGANQVKKLTWLLKAGKNAVITAKMESAVFPDQVKQFKTGGRL
jgi:hypothetical protein